MFMSFIAALSSTSRFKAVGTLIARFYPDPISSAQPSVLSQP